MYGIFISIILILASNVVETVIVLPGRPSPSKKTVTRPSVSKTSSAPQKRALEEISTNGCSIKHQHCVLLKNPISEDVAVFEACCLLATTGRERVSRAF